MNVPIRDIAYQLRQGQLIALADETGWSVAADPINDAAVERLLSLQTAVPAGLSPTVLVQNASQIGLYVTKLPDVAYDLVEFAENPLTVIYEQGKNVSLLLWQSSGQLAVRQTTGEIAVRRTLSTEIERLIGSFGRGLLTIPFESLVLPPDAELAVTFQFGTLPAMPRRPRILRLKTNGEIDFIRK